MNEVEAVKILGEQIGYANMMEIASALWRRKLKETNTPITGAFVPTILPFIVKKEQMHVLRSSELYDSIVEKYLEN